MANKHQPVITIERSGLDWALEGLAFSGLLVLLLLPAAYYSDLPDIIPHHFNIRGEADGFGPKVIVWVLPAIAVVLSFGITLLARNPHSFNYMVKITEQNAKTQYRMAIRLIRVLKAFVVLLFLYINWGIINGAITGKAEIGSWFLFVILGVNFGAITWYMAASVRKK